MDNVTLWLLMSSAGLFEREGRATPAPATANDTAPPALNESVLRIVS